MFPSRRICIAAMLVSVVISVPVAESHCQQPTASVPASRIAAGKRKERHDWTQWGGSSRRNNTPFGKNIPTTCDVATGKNIKWQAKLGAACYGTPVVANGKVFVCTNNAAAYLKRYPATVDLGVLLCFDEQTGKFLWQYSAEKLKIGRISDWPEQGICATPLVVGDRLWVVTNRCEVVCLDTNGFHDGTNNGPFQDETNENRDEADVVWKLDMRKTLGVFPFEMSTCSVTTDGSRLFVCTSNGVSIDNLKAPIGAPKAPSFVCLDRASGKVLWTDNSSSPFVLYGQWGSPAFFVAGGQPQVLFPGGDGWLYSFDPRGDGRGKSKLLWKFDCNPKAAVWPRGGRNSLHAMPCIDRNRVYIATGRCSEFGKWPGRLWCINPLKKLDGSDVSPTLAVDKTGKPLPRRRFQAVNPKKGERAIKNPNSAAIWQFTGQDMNGDGKIIEAEEGMSQSFTAAVIKDDILYISDFNGILHCLDANSGRQFWVYDLWFLPWGSPMVVENKVYVAGENGVVAIFPHTRDRGNALKKVGGIWEPGLGKIKLWQAIYTTPVVANNVLFIATKNTLFAIAHGKK